MEGIQRRQRGKLVEKVIMQMVATRKAAGPVG